jgi:beta-N-acetylhexosaminidase
MNVALAPVMDVNNNPANPVIGTRSFGEQADVVTAMGTAWLRGAQVAGIAACAKHFPGHGDTQVDSHAGLPRIDKTRAELERVELVPFRAAVTAGVAMVMPGHLMMPALDSERPSSLSRRIVTDLLRHEMGFTGVSITDALDMEAVRAEYGIPHAAVEAVWAGCDLVVPVVQHAETLAALQNALNEGYLSAEMVEASAERIRALRAQVGDTADANPAWLGAPEHREIAKEIARRAIRIVDSEHRLPLRNVSGFAVIEFALGKATVAEMGAYETGKVLQGLRGRVPSLKGIALAFNPSQSELHDARALAASASALILVTRQARHFSAQAGLIRECLAMGKPSVLIAMRDPYDLGLFPEARCTIAAFDDSPAMVNEVVRRVVG